MNNQMLGMLQQLKANPMQFFIQQKLNVPSGIMNNPNAILNHLMSSGQVTQQQVNNAYQMARSLSSNGVQR